MTGVFKALCLDRCSSLSEQLGVTTLEPYDEVRAKKRPENGLQQDNGKKDPDKKPKSREFELHQIREDEDPGGGFGFSGTSIAR